jgi:signal transduction histidine kinase
LDKVTFKFETDMKHRLRRLPKTLWQPAKALIPARPPWQKAVGGRKSEAPASANLGKPPGKSLRKSLQLQKQLRQLTHRVLATQEDERAKLSHELQNDIAQTLLGINVRLLLLKQAARSKARGLKNEIGSAQRLVVESTALVRRFARELDNHRPTLNERIVRAI